MSCSTRSAALPLRAAWTCIASHGRFLEIGKRDIWTPQQVAALGREIDYHIIYLGDVATSEPQLVGGILQGIVDAVAAGALTPLPMRTFALSDATEAFRYMAQARHIGKIVLLPAQNGVTKSTAIQADGTYLVTGGLEGIGLTVAAWLAEQGARHIVLVGRHAPSPDAAQSIDALRNAGANVVIEQANVAKFNDIAAVITRIDREMPALRGVFHAAGVLDDGVLAQQTWERFKRVLAPKVAGA